MYADRLTAYRKIQSLKVDQERKNVSQSVSDLLAALRQSAEWIKTKFPRFFLFLCVHESFFY